MTLQLHQKNAIELPEERKKKQDGPPQHWPRSKAVMSMALLSLVWGGSIPVTKIGLNEFTPLTLVSFRYIVSFPFFIFLIFRRPYPSFRDMISMIGLGTVGIGLGQTLQVFGVERTSASVATIIGAMIPIFMVVIVGLNQKLQFRFRHCLGIVIAFTGIVCVATGNPLHFLSEMDQGQLLGNLLMITSALAIALYFGLSTGLVERYSSATVTGWTSLAGAIALTPMLASEIFSTPIAVSWSGIAVIAYLSGLVTIFGVWIWLIILQRVPTHFAATLFYLQPVCGVVISATVFGDAIGTWFLIGTSLVLIGIVLSIDNAKRT